MSKSNCHHILSDAYNNIVITISRSFARSSNVLLVFDMNDLYALSSNVLLVFDITIYK